MHYQTHLEISCHNQLGEPPGSRYVAALADVDEVGVGPYPKRLQTFTKRDRKDTGEPSDSRFLTAESCFAIPTFLTKQSKVKKSIG